MSPYLDYEFVAVFKIRQDSNIYIYILCDLLDNTWKRKKSPNVMNVFFVFFP